MKRKSIVDKNFALSASFTKYAIDNPGLTSDLPKSACIIFADKSDNYLTRENMRIGREIRKNGEKCFRATKEGRRWMLEPMNA